MSIVDSTLVLVIFATRVKKRKVEIKMYIWLLEVRLKCFLDQFVLFIQSCKLPFRLRSMCCKDHYTATTAETITELMMTAKLHSITWLHGQGEFERVSMAVRVYQLE